jgi:hypothetical protein
MSIQKKSLFKTTSKRSTSILLALFVVVGALAPLLLSPQASAAQILNRSLSISSAVPGGTNVTYTVGDASNGFKFGTSHIVKGMKFEVCSTAVGTCTHPTGFSWASSGGYTLTNWQDATSFTKHTTNTHDCDGTNVATLCISRSGASTPENTSSNHRIVVTGVVNPNSTNCSSNPNCTFFVRMTSYTTATYVASGTDTGTVASSTVQTLTVNAAVAEVLNFCVGATTVDDATTTTGTDCSTIGNTSLNIGTLDTSATNASPVTGNGGDSRNGVAMIRTNAASGATISYDAIQQSGTNHKGALRISGATCTADANPSTDNTDQCINSQGPTQGAFNATTDTTEKFGMTIAGVNCGSTTAYSCAFGSGTYHVTRAAAYDGTGGNTYPTDAGAVVGATNAGYAWQEDGSIVQIASSSTVVDDEALILKFASHPMITTPFGLYAAQADFIAVPTY